MKTIPLVILSFLLSSCTYIQNRADDASDIIGVGIEQGGINASIQLSHLSMGLGASTQATGYNLLGRNFGEYYAPESTFLGWGKTHPGPDPDSEETVFPFFYRWDEYEIPYRRPEKKDTPWTHYTQVEISAMLQYGARVNVNIGEAIDFVLGFTTLDIAGDDLKKKASY